MSLFWEFFTFELKFRFKSISTYIYFFVWLMFSFLCVASENFGPIGASNGKVLLNKEHNTFEIVVDEMPTRAGIDPYNKLVDRVADDNMIDITKQ